MKYLSIATALAILIGSSAFCANSQPEPGGFQPRIETRNGKATIVLPDPALKSMRAAYPECRIPGQLEIKGEWQAASERRPFPFVAWGDYDGNGLVDVAVILLCKEGWLLVLSRQLEDRTFASHEIFGQRIDDPTNWYLATFERGRDRPREKFDEVTQEMRIVGKYKFKNDAVEIHHAKEGSVIFHWVSGKFEKISIGYE